MKQFSNYILFGILAIIFIVLYLPIFRELVYDWSTDDNYSHGFLIPVITLYFIWQKKNDLALIKLTRYIPGLVILIAGLLLLIVASASAEWFFARVSMIVVLTGIILYLFGKEIFKIIWLPILFLFFMIPLPYVLYYAITFPMQLLSTKVAAFFLQLIGFPVLRQGNIMHIPNYSLEVVEACSGLRSLMTLSALGAALAYIMHEKFINGVIHFISAIPIAIVANVFRIMVTALAAFLISPKFAEGFLHEMSGLLVFFVGFISLGITGAIIKWIDKKVSFKTS